MINRPPYAKSLMASTIALALTQTPAFAASGTCPGTGSVTVSSNQTDQCRIQTGDTVTVNNGVTIDPTLNWEAVRYNNLGSNMALINNGFLIGDTAGSVMSYGSSDSSLTNNVDGEIYTTGTSSLHTIFIDESTNFDFTNHGSIRNNTASNVRTVSVDSSTLSGFTNSGTIEATNTGTSAVYLEGDANIRTITIANPFDNSGTISGGTHAIRINVVNSITAYNTLNGFINSGTIESTVSGAAIYTTRTDITSFENSAGATIQSTNAVSGSGTVVFLGGTLGSFDNYGDIINNGQGYALLLQLTKNDGNNMGLATGANTVVSNYAGATIQNSNSASAAVFVQGGSQLGRLYNAGTIEGASDRFAVEAAAPNSIQELMIGGSSAIFHGAVDLVSKFGTPGVDGGNVVFESGAVYSPFTNQKFTVNQFNLSGARMVLAPDHNDPNAINPTVTTPIIYGNFNLAGGILQTDIINNTSYGQLEVEGSADLNGGSMHINVRQSGLLSAGTTFNDVITATDGITYGNFSITDNSALWDFNTVRGTNSLDLQLSSGDTGESAESTDGGTPGGTGGGNTGGNTGGGNTGGGSSTQGNLATAVLNSGMTTAYGIAPVLQGYANTYASNGTTGNTQMDNAILNLGLYSTEQELAAASASLAPASGAAGQQVSLATRQINHAIDERSDYLLSLNGQRPQGEQRYLWIQPIESRADQDRQDGVEGYDVDATGLLIGADGNLRDDLEVGVAFAYVNSEVDGDRIIGDYDSTIDTYQLALYGTLNLGGNRSIKAQAAAGQSEHDIDRQLFNGLQANADFSSFDTGMNVTFEQHFAVTPELDIAAIAGVEYQNIELDGYSESGAGALSLEVEDDRYESLVTHVGAQANLALTDNWLLMTEAKVGYDSMTSENRVSAQFVSGGDKFVTNGITPEEWVYNAMVGAKYNTGTGQEIAGYVRLQNRDQLSEVSVGLNLRWAF